MEVIVKKEMESDDDYYETQLEELPQHEDQYLQTTREDSRSSSKEDDGISKPNSQDSQNSQQLNDLNIPQYPLHCNICGETHNNINSFRVHLLTHNGEKAMFKCEQCHKEYPDVVKLKRHKYIHKYLPIKCELCDKTFTCSTNLKRHMRLHSGSKPFSCIECKESFTRRDKVNMHMLNVHGLQLADCIKHQIDNDELLDEEKLKITQTFTESLETYNKKLEDIDDHTIHIKTEAVDDTAACTENGEQNTSEASTSKHDDTNNYLFDHSRINLRMSSIPLNYCDICEKDFANSSILKRHMLIHSGEKPHPCTLCSKRYRDTCKLKEHMRTHSSAPIFCDICSKKFTDKVCLRRHKLIHNVNKPFQCDLCDKKFNRKDHLKAHKLLHMWNGDISVDTTSHSNNVEEKIPNNYLDDKMSLSLSDESLVNSNNMKQVDAKTCSFECQECHKVFTKISNLKRHKLVHTNDRLFNTKEKHEKINKILKKYQEYLLCGDQSSGCLTQTPEHHQYNGGDMKTNQNTERTQSNIWNPCLDSELAHNKKEDRNETSVCDSTEFTEGDSPHNFSDEVKPTDDIDGSCENKLTDYELEDFNVKKSIESAEGDDQVILENGGQGNHFVEICIPGVKTRVVPTVKKNKKKKMKNGDKEIRKAKKEAKKLLKVKSKIGFFPCNRCDGIYETRLLLRRHDCPNKEIFDCDGCGKKFLYMSALKIHQVVHSSERPFECPVCMKGFSLVHHLKGHLLIHSGEKRHQCDQCMKRFTSSSDLKKHLFSHTGEKKYPCTECQKMFKRSCDVKRHMLTHTGDKPHVCGYCNKRFSQSPHLNSHLLIHFREFQPRESSEIVFGNGE